jgi:CheY-like chemotaxis protein
MRPSIESRIALFGAELLVMDVIVQMPRPARRLVLVADDEAAIQLLVARVITQLGLDALPVGDGAAAITAVAARRANLACAVLDITMPLMNGVDAARAIQRLAPELAIVLMSGAVPAHMADSIKQLRLAGMLHKPFSLVTLRELIRRVIDDNITIETV